MIAQCTTEENERAERQHVAVEDPLQSRDAEMEIARDRREGDRRHESFDEHRARSENRTDENQTRRTRHPRILHHLGRAIHRREQVVQ